MLKIIRGGRLLDIEAHAAPFADILIDGNTIREIGAPGLAAPDDAELIDASNRLMHPGLINGHTHGHNGLAKGFADRWTLELLLTAGPWITGSRTLEDKYLSTSIGAAEMLLKGCTACYDLTLEIPGPSPEGLAACAKAYLDAGMRVVIAPMVADTTFFDAIPGLADALPDGLQREVEAMKLAPAETTLARLRDCLEHWSNDPDMARPAVAPTIPLHCSDGLMTGCRDIARSHGIGLHSHVAESKVQAVSGRETYGRTLVQHMDHLGLIGPDFVAAHGVWLDDDDMRILARHGASVSHNPASNAMLGSGVADARRMLELGVNLAIGTDACTCGDHLNMYEAMRAALYVSHAHGPVEHSRWLSAAEALRAATEGSARALGFDKLGRIAPGYKADIVFLDLNSINLIPLNDPVVQIVQSEDGRSVDAVMVDGRMVVEGGKLLNVDLARLTDNAEAACERLAEANRDKRDLFDRLAPIVKSYCPGMAAKPYHINRFVA